MTATDLERRLPLIMTGAFGDDESDSYGWELWLEGDVLILNIAVDGGAGIYLVSGPLNVDQADRLGKALASGVGLLRRQALDSDE